MLNGILNLYKPEGITSHDCVAKIRKLYRTPKVGHCGTLDPLAEGVLPVVIGNATKLLDFIVNHDKKYRAVIRFGIATDTQDITGQIISESAVIPSYDEIISILPDFIGEIDQIPPMYSALKVGGKKLYELARRGQIIDRKARQVTVYDITLNKTQSPFDFILDVHCGKGTYIRTLCHDIGGRLGCGAVMSSLERVSAGGFNAEDSVTLDELEENLNCLMTVEDFLSNCYHNKLELDSFYYKLILNGVMILLNKLTDAIYINEYVLLYYENKFFALGKITLKDNQYYLKNHILFK